MNLFNKLKQKRFTEHKEFYAKMRELNIPREKKKEYFREAFNSCLTTPTRFFYNEALDKTIKQKLTKLEAIENINKIVSEERNTIQNLKSKRYNFLN